MIYIIITTSILNHFGIQNDLHRNARYIDCIQTLLQLIDKDVSMKPIIVENNGLRQTFLDDLACDVLYTNNNVNTIHKGENELLDLKEVIHQYNIQDDDFIIKLTGRYKLLNLNFINLVKNNCDIYDAFVKFFNVSTNTFMYDDCVLGLFAIKCKYLKTFHYQFINSGECEFAQYVRANVNNILEIEQLDLECCFAEDLRLLCV